MRLRRAELHAQLLSLLREHVDERIAIRPSTTLSGELGLGSVELLEIAAEVEDRLGVRLPDEALPSLRTVGDVVEAIERQLAERGELAE